MSPSRRFAGRLAWLAAGLILLTACSPSGDPELRALRLVDLFPSATVTDSPADLEPPPPTEWRFTESLDGWAAGPGIAELALRDGRLVGRSTSDFPLLHVERPEAASSRDLLHRIEVRARVSAGQNLDVFFSGSEELDFGPIIGQARALPGANRTPIVPEEELRTYVVTPSRSVDSTRIRHLLLRPTDVPDAEFEIESVRLVFRREHLLSIPAGLGWHGMGEIYHESVVSRAPETVSYSLTLPSRPRLDLAMATIEDLPVTFTVEIESARGGATVLERTVTRPHRWDTARVDLADFAGQEVELRLRLAGATDGALGFWGSPAIRNLGSGGGDGKPRSVLMIVADTLRADHLDLYGYGRPTAPVLSRVASQGLTFRDCAAQATWTKVSFSSFLSGLHPLTHGVTEFHDLLPATATTLAEAFRDAGFATLSLSSISFNGKFTNLHQGYEVLHESASLPRDSNSKTAVHLVDRLLPWLEAHREVPFFAVLHVADPHAPYRPYEPYDQMWAEPGSAEAFQEQVDKVLPVIESPLMRRFQMPTRDELEQVGVDPDAFVDHELDWYDGSIRAMDAELGRVFERLDELGLDDRVLVAFLADHGTEFLEHGRHWHGHSVYGELAQVPLVFKGPGVPRGEVRDDTVQTIDLMPTLLEMAGIPIPGGVQGRSLVPLVRGDGRRPLPAFSYKAAQEEGSGPPPLDSESIAMVADGWKLVRHYQRSDDGPEFELFDHRRDPLNKTNVADDNREIVERMAAELEAWRAKAEAEKLDDAAALEEMSAEELERLRSLGYVD